MTLAAGAMCFPEILTARGRSRRPVLVLLPPDPQISTYATVVIGTGRSNNSAEHSLHPTEVVATWTNPRSGRREYTLLRPYTLARVPGGPLLADYRGPVNGSVHSIVRRRLRLYLWGIGDLRKVLPPLSIDERNREAEAALRGVRTLDRGDLIIHNGATYVVVSNEHHNRNLWYPQWLAVPLEPRAKPPEGAVTIRPAAGAPLVAMPHKLITLDFRPGIDKLQRDSELRLDSERMRALDAQLSDLFEIPYP